MTTRSAFTMIEVLVSISVGMVIIALVHLALSGAQQSTDQYVSLIERYRRAQSLYQYLKNDMATLQQQCAVRFEGGGSAGPATLFFVRSKHDNQPYRYSTLEGARYLTGDLSWVRWHWDGHSIKRAETRLLQETGDNVPVVDFLTAPQEVYDAALEYDIGGELNPMLEESRVLEHVTEFELCLINSAGAVLDGSFTSIVDGQPRYGEKGSMSAETGRPSLVRLRVTLHDPEVDHSSTFHFSFALPSLNL